MLLIDVYNILHLPAAADINIRILCGLLGQSRYAGQRLIALCDGYPPATLTKKTTAIRKSDPRSHNTPLPILMKIRGVEVCFVGSDRTADDEIEKLLRKHRGQTMIVISTDRRLRRAAKRAGATSIISQTFLDRLLADQDRLTRRKHPAYTRDIPLDPYSVAYWCDVFGLDKDPPIELQTRSPARPSTKKPGKSPARPSQYPGNPPESQPQKKNTLSEKSLTVPKPEHPLAPEHLADDPVLRDALTAWAGRMTLDELDMDKWLKSHPPGTKHKPNNKPR